MMVRCAVVALLAVGACNCDEPEVIQVKRTLNIEPNPLDFGEVALAQKREEQVTLSNPTQVAIEIISCELSADSEPSFALGECPGLLPSGTSAVVEVSFAPIVEDRQQATLVLTTADLDIGTVEVPITGYGVDEGLPVIVVDPEQLNYPPTAAGDVGILPLTVTNRGSHDLLISSVEVVCPDALECPFRALSAGSIIDQPISPDLFTELRVAFEPPDLGGFSGVLRLHSNDLARPTVEVPLEGSGHEPPVAQAQLVNNPDNIAPLDQVVFDGRSSFSPVEDISIAEYHWSLIARPPGSTAVVQDADLAEAGLMADLAGDYTVELFVVDSEGVRSVSPAILQFRAVPKDAVHVQLTWDHPNADLDLHFIRANAANPDDPFAAFDLSFDAYFSNRFPDDWYDEQRQHPRLDIDDQRGFGPENINIEEPAEDTFQAWVHYWNDNSDSVQPEPTEAVLRVYIHGLLTHEAVHWFDSDQVMWKAIQMDWPDLNFRDLNESFPYERPF
jgi:hypothetical protein